MSSPTKSNKVHDVSMINIKTSPKEDDSEKGGENGGEKGGEKDDEKGGSNGVSGATRSNALSVSNAGADKPTKSLFTAPLMALLAVVENLPLLIALMLVWNYTSNEGEKHIDTFVGHGRHVADAIIESKMDSIMDSAIQKMKGVYEHALSTAKSGALAEQQGQDEPYFEQIKMLSFWTESVAMPYHYEMVHVTFACNGHVIGTGYDYENKEYLAWYTDMQYAQSHAAGLYNSSRGIVYGPDGCNTVDKEGTLTKETTYRTTFTDKDGWLAIETPGFNDHGDMTIMDGRLDQNYADTKASSHACSWSSVFVGLEEPYHLSKSVSVSFYKPNGGFGGTVSATILLDEVVTMIDELSQSLDTLSVIVVEDKGDKVIAASEGNNAHPITSSCTGEREVELYTVTEYADIVKKESGNRYNYLLTYIDEHPEFHEKMNDKSADISDETQHHYYSTHGTFITTAGETMLLSAIKLVDKCGLNYHIYIILNEEEMITEMLEQNELAHVQNQITTRNTLIGVFAACLFWSLLGFGLARAIAVPLEVIRKDIYKISRLDFTGKLTRFRPFVTDLKTMINQYIKLKITLADFNSFVPPHIVEELVELGDEAIERKSSPKDIATLFIYVNEFSAASHNSDAEIIAEFANAFIGGAADIVSNMSGTVIDFFGESLFGIFNAPYDDPDYIKNAMECANEVLALFQRIKGEFMAIHPDFELISVRIGLHCGTALVGKIGSQARLKYCAVGDTVNVGARIENMNRRYGSNMTCSADFLEALGDNKSAYCSRPMEYVKVQGRNEALLLYEIGGMINGVEAGKLSEFEDHTSLFFDVRAGQAGEEEMEKHIAKYGGNSKFIRAASIDISALQEVKKCA